MCTRIPADAEFVGGACVEPCTPSTGCEMSACGTGPWAVPPWPASRFVPPWDLRQEGLCDDFALPKSPQRLRSKNLRTCAKFQIVHVASHKRLPCGACLPAAAGTKCPRRVRCRRRASGRLRGLSSGPAHTKAAEARHNMRWRIRYIRISPRSTVINPLPES